MGGYHDRADGRTASSMPVHACSLVRV